MGDITQHTASDGMIYLRTHHGGSAEEIAAALTPFVGRVMSADLPNRYRRYRVKLLAVDGGRVTVQEQRSGQQSTFDAFDVFGTSCTMIEPEARNNGS